MFPDCKAAVRIGVLGGGRYRAWYSIVLNYSDFQRILGLGVSVRNIS